MSTATLSTRAASTAPKNRRRAANVAVWAIQIFLAAFMLFASATPKFAGQKDAVEDFTKIGWGQWFRYFTGACEAAGAIGLVIPRLATPAAIGLVGVMIGAVLTQLLVLDPVWALLPAAYGVLFVIIAWYRRPQAAELLARLRH
jgi:hypothetical protein